MTYPGSGGPWQPNDPNQQPGYPQQGGYPQQPQQGYPQPGYQQQPGYQTGPQPQQGYPQTGPQPQQGYPQTGPQPQQGYPQPGYPQTGPQPTQQYPGYGTPPPGFPQPKKSRKGLIIGAIVAVVAIAAGSVVTVMALNRSETKAGSPDPTAAADALVKAIGQGDVVGVLASLAPAESSILVDLQKDMTEELKRLEVYKKDADPNKLPGMEVKAENLTYDDNAAEKVNDHITITKLTGGKVTIDSDLSKLPLTDKFIETVFPRGMKNAKPQHEEVDIAEFIQKENKGKPIRIATVKDGDKWYPSLFYTIADYALQAADKPWPKQGIANNGASSPEQAVQELAQAATEANLERVIELLPPDEMGALHDAGPVLLEEVGSPKSADVKINKFQGEQQDVTNGKKVLIKEVQLTVEGEDITVRRDGECYSYEGNGQKEKFCASEVAQQMGGKRLSPEAKTALTHLATGMLKNTGIVTTNVGGKWYVSPLRSFTDIELTVLKSLDAKDAYALLKMIK